MKLDFAVVKLAFRQVHALQGVRVYDVETAAAIHQHLGEPEVVDNWVDDKGVFAGVRYVIRVIISILSDWLLRPV